MTQPDPHQSNTRMGQVMMAIGFIIAIILLTFVFDGLRQDQFNPNTDPASTVTGQGAVEVALQRNRQGHYIVSGAVNGVDVDFILDTGATDVVIPEGVAERAGLEYGFRSRAMTANGTVDIYSTTIDELKLADITLRDVQASINPGMNEGMVLLGMSALQQIEFNQRGSRLTLRYFPGD